MKKSTIKDALSAGQKLADEILQERKRILRERARRQEALYQVLISQLDAAGPGTAAKPLSAAHVSAGYLIAEGDSWFNYPKWDILKILEDEFCYEIESVAHHGDLVEEMAYNPNQLDGLIRRFEKMIKAGKIPRAILLSGGGNDIAGSEFAVLLNHASSAKPGFNSSVVEGIVGERIQMAYLAIISAVSRISIDQIGKKIPIVLHGYDYPVPDGRGFWGGWWFLPGPWLEPGFRVKGYEGLQYRKDLIHSLIDRFNQMLKDLPEMAGMDHVHLLDLRKSLKTDPNYKDWWDNELHPTEKGFRKIARIFDDLLKTLP